MDDELPHLTETLERVMIEIVQKARLHSVAELASLRARELELRARIAEIERRAARNP